LVELAKQPNRTDINEIQEIHALVLDGRASAGQIREEEIRITGTEHKPPKYYGEIMAMLSQLEAWSKDERNSHPIIRAAVIHAWLVHIHPFLDGNGRAARAIGNLQLIRGGLPPIIIKKIERKHYLEGIRHSDYAGDIGPFLDYVIQKSQGSLTGLENAAREKQGYSPVIAKLRNRQKDLLRVWNTSIQLLREMLFREIDELSVNGIEYAFYDLQLEIDLDDYVALASRDPSGNAQLFRIRTSVPSIGVKHEFLFWIGFRNSKMIHSELDQQLGPSIFVSIRNDGYPPWIEDEAAAIGFNEATIKPGYGDIWFVRGPDSKIRRKSMSQFVKEIIEKTIS
jgi:fido (protein-threonine AMPylation protein)